jgi:hypothetical protein
MANTKKTTKTTAVKKPVAKKAAAVRKPKTPAPLKVPAKAEIEKLVAGPTAASSAGQEVTAAERFRMIEQEAYFLAEKDGFKGSPDSYWFAAEKQVSEALR